MSQQAPDILKTFSLRRILWPALIGLIGTFALIFYRDVVASDGEIRQALANVSWGFYSLVWVLLGFGMMVLRDLAYIWRMRLLTDEKLSWSSSFYVTMLWEFSSAVSPSVVGGSALAVFMLAKEKISVGRSTAIVFVTIFWDEVFYLAMIPLVLFLVGGQTMFAPVLEGGISFWSSKLVISFWIVYAVIFLYTTFLAFALFIHPKGIHKFIKRIFLTRLLKRWHKKAFKMANDLLLASEEFRAKPLGYWLKVWLSTIGAWISRYLVLNCVIAAFAVSSMGFQEHAIAFARQAVMFIMMLISPTPGSTGVAEWIFTTLLADLTPVGLGIALAALWRLISYYPYLLIGPILLPRWLRTVYPSKSVPPTAKTEDKDDPRLASTEKEHTPESEAVPNEP